MFVKTEPQSPIKDSQHVKMELYDNILLENPPEETLAEPLSIGLMPSIDDYPGQCQFHIDCTKPSKDKGSWQYSKELNKLFVSMDCEIPVNFSWIKSELGLCIRALPVFVNSDDFREVVQRCPTHVNPVEKSNKDFFHVEHIIRCAHPGAIYDKSTTSQRLSVLVPVDGLQSSQSGPTSITYSFMCKNSCSLGINRRRTAIIFTLERINGEVIGRRFVNLKICSCPKRDMMKEQLLNAKVTEERKQETDDDQPRREIGDEDKGTESLPQDLVMFQIRTPGSYAQHFAKVLKEMVLSGNVEELSAAEKITVEDCNKYIP